MAPQKPQLVNVAVMAALRGPLTYRVPEGTEVRAGQRVLVPLGSRKAIGIALDAAAKMAPGVALRDILRVLDSEPVLSPELLTLGLWIAEYYLAPPGEVFRAMVPLRPETRRVRVLHLTPEGIRRLNELGATLLEETRHGNEAALLAYLAERPGAGWEGVRERFGEALAEATSKGWIAVTQVQRERRRPYAVRLTAGLRGETAGSDKDRMVGVHGPVPERLPRLSPVARRILEELGRQGGTADDHRQLLSSARGSLRHLRKLQDRGLIQLTLQDSALSNLASEKASAQAGNLAPDSPLPDLRLSAAQTRALQELEGRLEKREFAAVLLHGVTGSGKTEIYLRLIARSLELGRSALLLVPEIALTPAVQAEFQRRFGARVAILHSAMGEAEREGAWHRAWAGEARVVLGTRSAVFAPLADLGVIIVDEEHDASYKQEETPRYHGRDVAVVRARLARALVVLGSATPSLESYYNAQRGKYSLVTLEERVGGRPLASVEIVDMRQEFRQTFTQVPISRRLHEEIETQLRTGAQTMILLNRRGYSWFLLCRSCGQTRRCVNCSISLTYHRRERRLICHYCGYSAAIPTQCPDCGSEYLYYVGEGTEKIEDKLKEAFPEARVARLDRDVARRPGEYRRLLSDFRERKIDILVGTQLIAKGHDFPGVTLVGVVSADQALGFPDFRSAERTFQLLTQAAGRAGRGDLPGRVIVQTFYPEHYAIRLAAEQNYGGFFAKEMSFRRLMHYPPVTAMANLVAQHKDLTAAARIARGVEQFLTQNFGDSPELKILGPGPAPLSRIQGLHRIQVLLKARTRATLNSVLRRLLDHCEAERIPPRALLMDVDPVSVM